MINSATRQQLPTATGFAVKCAMATLRKHGGAAGPLLHRAGLSERGFDDPQHRVTAAAQGEFLEYAAEAMNDTVFGLHLAEQANPREAGLLFYVVSAARNLGEALSLFARYCRIVNESVRLKLTRQSDGVIVDAELFWDFAPSDQAERRVSIRGCRQGPPRDRRPRRAPEPSGVRARAHRGLARIRAVLRMPRRVRNAV